MTDSDVVSAFIRFLRGRLDNGAFNDDQSESLEVAIQCLQTAFNVGECELSGGAASAAQLFSMLNPTVPQRNEPTDAQKIDAEQLKNEGNEQMKQSNFQQAIEKYDLAIALHNNPVFYCNRAAAYSKMEKYDKSAEDCRTALGLDPQYSKAYGRLGLALTCQKKYGEAVDAYEKAVELEPANESFKNNLEIAKQRLAESNAQPAVNAGNPFAAMMGGAGGMGGLGNILQNPAMMQMAGQMMTDPNMQNMMANLMGGATNAQESGQPQGMDSLLRAGQQLASQMQQSNPDLVEQLRRQFQGDGNPDGNPDGGPPPGSI